MTMTPTVGRIVHLRPGSNSQLYVNGQGPADPIPAIIVRVWNDTVVNLQVFVDGPAPIWVTSVQHSSVSTPGNMQWDWPEIIQGVVPTGKPLS